MLGLFWVCVWRVGDVITSVGLMQNGDSAGLAQQISVIGSITSKYAYVNGQTIHYGLIEQICHCKNAKLLVKQMPLEYQKWQDLFIAIVTSSEVQVYT